MRTAPRAAVLAAALLPAALACATGGPRPVPALFPVLTAWTAAVGDSIHGPLASDGGRVFVATRDGVLRALQRLSGDTLWQVPDRPGVLSYGGGALVLRGAEGTIWSIDPATGSARWRVDTPVGGDVPVTIGGDHAFVAGQGLARLALADGATAWSAPEGRSLAPAVPAGDRVYTVEEDGTLRARDAASGATVWTFATDRALASAPVVDARGRVLVGTTDRRFLALDGEGRVRWTWRVGADIRTPPVLVDDLVVFAAYDDVLYGLVAGNGHLRWRAALPSRPQSGPVLVSGAVLVACHGGRPGETLLAGFDGANGARLGDLKAPGEGGSAPLLVERHLYLGMREKRVIGFVLGG